MTLHATYEHSAELMHFSQLPPTRTKFSIGPVRSFRNVLYSQDPGRIPDIQFHPDGREILELNRSLHPGVQL